MEQKLERRLSPGHVWAVAFGCVIGWGSFINPGKKFLPDSGVFGTGIAMVMGALVMIVIALSYAYMVPKYPSAGGEFSFAKNCFGKKAAFVCGWFLAAAYLANVPMNATAIGLVADGVDGSLDLLKKGFRYNVAGFEICAGELVFSAGIVILLGILNIIGVRRAVRLQMALSVLLAACAVILCVSAVVSAKASAANLAPVWGFDKKAALALESPAYMPRMAHKGASGILSAILTTFAIAPWAYVGFDTIPQAAEEFNFSSRKVIFIMITAIVFGCFVYVSNNTVAAAALKRWPDLALEGRWVLLLAAQRLLGTFGTVLVGVGVFCAVLSGIMGFYLASSRLLYSMGRDGYLPAWFGHIDGRFHTPKNAVVFCMLVSLSGPVLGREALGWFVDMSAIGASIGYLFTCLSALHLSRRYHDMQKGRQAVALFGAVFAAGFMFLQLVPVPGLDGVCFGPQSYAMLVFWVVFGAVFFCLTQRKAQN